MPARKRPIGAERPRGYGPWHSVSAFIGLNYENGKIETMRSPPENPQVAY
jgi:hypothetical protein